MGIFDYFKRKKENALRNASIDKEILRLYERKREIERNSLGKGKWGEEIASIGRRVADLHREKR